MASFYDASGKRIRIERGTLMATEQVARRYIAEHVCPEALKRILIDSKAAEIVSPVELETACLEYSEAQKLLLPLQASLSEAVRFYVAKKQEDLRSVTAAFAVDDFVAKFKGRRKTGARSYAY